MLINSTNFIETCAFYEFLHTTFFIIMNDNGILLFCGKFGDNFNFECTIDKHAESIFIPFKD
jgi:hypothetical protein